ncbi:Ig-like domain-containing protein, partial [Bacteroidota bacterium]
VALGYATQVGDYVYPEVDWLGQTGDEYPFTQQFIYAAEAGVPGSPETVDVDVTMKVDGHKFDPETGEILDSLMYVYIMQTYRLAMCGAPGEGLGVPNGDVRQFNDDEIFTFVFEGVNNTPPNTLFPDVQMGLYALAAWANPSVSCDVYLNGEMVGYWYNQGDKGDEIYPLVTDPVSMQEMKIVLQKGDTLQLKGNPDTYMRLNALMMVMEDTEPPTGLNLSAEGGTAEITVNNDNLRILAEVLPEKASDTRITWSLENNDIGATINQGGFVHAWPRDAGNGTVTVRGTVGQGDAAVSSTLEVTISGQEDIPVDSIYLYPGGAGNRDTIDLNGGARQIWAEVYPEIAANKEVEWTVDDNGTGATIDETGLLRASATDDGNGTVIVKATAMDGSGVSDTISIVIMNQESLFVESIAITYDGEFPEIIENAGTLQLYAEVTPAVATDTTVTWSLENNDIGATIDQTGLLTASGKTDGNGLVTVKAAANDGSGVFATVDVTIVNQSNVSVPQTALQRAVSLYPNPVNGNQALVIEISENVAFIEAIRIFDVTGRKVAELQDFSGNASQTILSFNKEKGIYLIKVDTDKGSVIQRVLVK